MEVLTINKIKFKKYKAFGYYIKHKYLIYSGNTNIGEIYFRKKNKIFILGYLQINDHYKKQHYGYKVINYILSHYKISCIVGETLYESTGFWQKCIKKFNGKRMNIRNCYDCSSSFVIPKKEISYEDMYDLLNIALKIII